MKEPAIQTKMPEAVLQKASARSSPVLSIRSTLHPILQLQRAIGNQGVQRFIQAKLTISQPGDLYEQEADLVADQVMATPAHHAVSGTPPRIQRFSGQSNGQPDAVPASVDQALASPGRPLDPALRQDMEQRFGHDFSRVQVHYGTVAERSAQEVNAHAYTVGHDIVFGAGQFAPRMPDGRRLIAHELAHVVQQTDGENRAALRLSTAGTLVIQRDAAVGLRKKEEFSGFTSLARDFWSDNKDKSLEEFGLFLMGKVNAQLKENGVPPIRDPPSFGPTGHGAAGGFSHQTWTVNLDLAKTAAHPLATKISDLTADQVAEVAGVCYHEARHAEQAFLVARVVASGAKGKKDAKAIAAELGIPESVAEAAMNSTDPLPGKGSIAQIEQWRAFGESGKHHDYWDWNEIFRHFVGNVIASLPKPRPEGVDRVIAAWTSLTPTIAGWRKDSLPPLEVKIGKLTKAKTTDAVDKLVLRDAKKIRAGMQKVIKAEKALSDEVAKFQARKAAADKRPITVSEARGIQSQFASLWIDLELEVLKLGQTTDDAYRAYPIEADAYAAEASVIKTFLSKPKTAAPKP
jgi:hypothetical protein